MSEEVSYYITCYNRPMSMSGTNNPNYKHGGYYIYKAERNSWRGMMMRCYSKNYRYYHRYGGRGIEVCERWRDPDVGFRNFLQDMGRRPAKHSLDRINNDGNYCPDNCRWATQKEQVCNSTKKTNAKVTAEQIAASGLKCATVWGRIKKGWSVEKALSTPLLRQKRG